MNIDKDELKKIIQEEIENLVNRKKKRGQDLDEERQNWKDRDAYIALQKAKRSNNPIIKATAVSSKPWAKKGIPKPMMGDVAGFGGGLKAVAKGAALNIATNLEETIVDLNEVDLQPMPKSGAREPDPKYRDPREEDYEIEDQEIADALNTATSHIHDAYNMTRGPYGVVDEKMRKVVMDHITSLYRNFVLGRDASLGLSDDEPEEVPGLKESIYDINEADLFEVDENTQTYRDESPVYDDEYITAMRGYGDPYGEGNPVAWSWDGKTEGEYSGQIDGDGGHSRQRLPQFRYQTSANPESEGLNAETLSQYAMEDYGQHENPLAEPSRIGAFANTPTDEEDALKRSQFAKQFASATPKPSLKGAPKPKLPKNWRSLSKDDPARVKYRNWVKANKPGYSAKKAAAVRKTAMAAKPDFLKQTIASSGLKQPKSPKRRSPEMLAGLDVFKDKVNRLEELDEIQGWYEPHV